MEVDKSRSGSDTAAVKRRRSRGRPSVFSECQKRVLLRYYDDYDMKSTHRRNEDLMKQAVTEAQTSIERVKRFIGAENARRRRVLLQNTHKGMALNNDQTARLQEDAQIAHDSNSDTPSESGSY